jgi:hypothetical protein
VQSTALLVLAATKRIDFPVFLFCNVGDDSEHPDALRYVREVAAPYAAASGITLHILDRHTRDGNVETLFGRLTKEGSRSIPIPVKMSRTGAPGTRSCTADFKIKVISKWLKAHGATKDRPAITGLGISLDEIQRARTTSGEAVQTLVYPLLTLRMDRSDCTAVIRAAGLPVPPKSSCWFCPFHTNAAWQRQREEEPALFAQSVALEKLLNDRRAQDGRDGMFFHNRLKPLDLATTANRQGRLFEEQEDACESGYCMV